MNINWRNIILGALAILAVSYVTFARAATPVAPVATSQDIQLVWTAPTKNTDGTTLTNLSGFKLYHRLSTAKGFDPPIVLSMMATKYVFPPGDGTHFYALTAFNSAGQESAPVQCTIGVNTLTLTRIPNTTRPPQVTVKP